MRSRIINLIVVVVLAVAALAIGVAAVAGAGQTKSLPAISAADLLSRMAQEGRRTGDMSGDVAWHNTLLGDLSSMESSTFGGAPGRLPLFGSGSGRVWLDDNGVRLESQGAGGDQTIVVNGDVGEAWVYDYAADTAKHMVVNGEPRGGVETPSPLPSSTLATPQAIASFLARLAPYATVDVAGQDTVAGRESYLLTMTPTAPDTALGVVRAAIDGETFVPLELEVFAKDGGAPVLSIGFTSVTYAAVPASTFDFAPPAGAKVTTKTVDLSETGVRHESTGSEEAPDEARRAEMRRLMQRGLLTVAEAQELVDFRIASAKGYTARPFGWAAVVDQGGPLTAAGRPVIEVLRAAGMDALPGGDGGASPDRSSADGARSPAAGPTAVLVYGSGFGAILLAEARTTPELQRELRQLPEIVETTAGNGVEVRSLSTSLGGVHVWQLGDTTLVAGGMVPDADLEAFVRSVR